MPKDQLKGTRDHYDVVVIGSGLAGLTAANTLARAGHSVLLLEHHYQLGGMATWFKRRGGHIFDISLHGFPIGMIKSCRKYWTREIADSIVQLKGIRFENPQFSLQTSFDREDFTRLLIEKFGIEPATVQRFFDTARSMNFYDDQTKTVRELFEEFFPGRDDVVRLLMEPITYANGSTLEDPAITYGIVFSNFMHKGVYTFQGGTDKLITQMRAELEKNGVDIRIRSLVEKIEVSNEDDQPAGASPRFWPTEPDASAFRLMTDNQPQGASPRFWPTEPDASAFRLMTDNQPQGASPRFAGRSHSRRVTGVIVNGKRIGCRAVVSNANLKSTILKLVGSKHFDKDFVEETRAVRLNNSSCQVYLAMKPGVGFDYCGDLLFHSEHKGFDIDAMLSRAISSRTFSFYYPDTRPGSNRWLVVSSTNANYRDWAELPEEEYRASKKDLQETTLDCLEQYIPNVREKLDWAEVSTPRTFQHYTRHVQGASFGTKFEGLKVSKELPQHMPGLYHAGSVGIIMSGWLGAVNYGVIVANDVDKFLVGGVT